MERSKEEEWNKEYKERGRKKMVWNQKNGQFDRKSQENRKREELNVFRKRDQKIEQKVKENKVKTEKGMKKEEEGVKQSIQCKVCEVYIGETKIKLET